MKAWKQHVKLMTVYFLVCHRLSGACIRELAWKKEKQLFEAISSFSHPFSWVSALLSLHLILTTDTPSLLQRIILSCLMSLSCKAGWSAQRLHQAKRAAWMWKLWWWQTGRCWRNMAETTSLPMSLLSWTWWAELSAAFLWRRHLVVAYDCLFLPLLLPLVMCKVFFC